MAMNEIDDEDVIDTSEADETPETPTHCVRCGQELKDGDGAMCADAAGCWENLAMETIEERDGLVNAVARAEKERDQLRDGYRRELSVNGQLRTALDSARKQSDDQLARRLHAEALAETLVRAAGERLLSAEKSLERLEAAITPLRAYTEQCVLENSEHARAAYEAFLNALQPPIVLTTPMHSFKVHLPGEAKKPE